MRLSLFYNPLDLLERLATASRRQRRHRRLLGTPAAALSFGHIDSLELLELLQPIPPAVIYDIGANIGTWTCLAKSIFPSAQVEAFEPLATHFSGFRQWTAPWPNDVRLHACALGVNEGTADMQVMSFSDASSLLPLAAAGREEFNIQFSSVQPVPVMPLDVLVARAKLAPPDLIKLDVQGSELDVLRGGERCLTHARAVLCEVSFRPYYEGQPLFADVVAFMRERGFDLCALGESTALGAPLVQADALFMHPT